MPLSWTWFLGVELECWGPVSGGEHAGLHVSAAASFLLACRLPACPGRSLLWQICCLLCRAAVLALASEVIVANTAVSSSLDALMATDDMEGSARCAVAAALQGFAMSLESTCPPVAETTDSNMAVNVLLAGVAVVECGSKANAMQFLSASHAQYHAHCFSHLVENLQRIGSRHSQALQMLRATTFKPAVLLACLRRMLRACVGQGMMGQVRMDVLWALIILSLGLQF